MESGGKVIACGNPGNYIEGIQDDLVYDGLHSMWTVVDTANTLNAQLQGLLHQRIASSSPWVTGVAHMRRVLGGRCSPEMWHLEITRSPLLFGRCDIPL